ncbi:pantoate--beta-alanine ligase [bacterium]|nr:pantoate--beta-alanine ligase [bacterium]
MGAENVSGNDAAKAKRSQTVKTVATEKLLRPIVERWRCNHKKIGFVPTMGALHEGHIALIREAKKTCDKVVVSIFVNPLQFGPSEDLGKYPRDIKRDSRLLTAEKVDLLFAPESEEMYPDAFNTQVLVGENLTRLLCGESRPRHFSGVTTVVAKLLTLVRPHITFFGQKDFQQTLIIQRMVADLTMGSGIVMLPTVRETDGLAKSSRNQYLTEEERRAAPAVYQALKLAEGMLQVGERNPKDLLDAVRKRLQSEPLMEIDYIAAKNADTLEDLNILAGPILVAVAVVLGKTRLIDNILMDVPSGS